MCDRLQDDDSIMCRFYWMAFIEYMIAGSILLDYAILTVEKEYAISFSEQHKKVCLSLHYNGANSFSFVNGVRMYILKAKYSEINAVKLRLGNVSKNVSTNNMKRLDYMDIAMIFK